MYRGITTWKELTSFFFWNWFSDLFSWQQFSVWQELSPAGNFTYKEENLFTNQIKK